MSTQLEKNREQIDAIDEQLAKLFEERFEVIREIVDYKIEHGLQVLDSSREAAIIAKNAARITDEEVRRYFREWYIQMLAHSRAFQKEIMDGK